MISGVESNSPPCPLSAPNSACLPQLYPGDVVKISYAVNTTTPANATSTVTLKACFGPQSSVNRAWRKPNANITLDKQCSTKIAANLPPEGEFNYIISSNVPPAVYRVLAMEFCTGGAVCGLGASQGFYEVNLADVTPSWLMALVGVFATIGPLTLIGFFVTERYLKKNK